MTNNELFGLFCAFILGTIIIWDTFSRKKTVHVHNFFTCPSGPILYEKEWWNGKVEDHKKVLEDIKKVEKVHLPTSERAGDIFRYMREVRESEIGNYKYPEE